MIIGSNKQKDAIIQQGITPRLIQLLGDPSGGDELKLEGTVHIFIYFGEFKSHLQAIKHFWCCYSFKHYI